MYIHVHTHKFTHSSTQIHVCGPIKHYRLTFISIAFFILPVCTLSSGHTLNRGRERESKSNGAVISLTECNVISQKV